MLHCSASSSAVSIYFEPGSDIERLGRRICVYVSFGWNLRERGAGGGEDE